MPEKFVSPEDQKAWETYQRVRLQVETPENIGRVMVVDTDTGDYAIDDGGLEATNLLRQRNPQAHLFGLRIGYRVMEVWGGTLEESRLPPL